MSGRAPLLEGAIACELGHGLLSSAGQPGACRAGGWRIADRVALGADGEYVEWHVSP